MNVLQLSDTRDSGAVIRLREDMHGAETALDDALLASSRLMQSVIDARRSLARAPHAGQKALIRLVRAQQSIVNGANDVFRVHDELNTVGREMGIVDEHKRQSGLADHDLQQTA